MGLGPERTCRPVFIRVHSCPFVVVLSAFGFRLSDFVIFPSPSPPKSACLVYSTVSSNSASGAPGGSGGTGSVNFGKTNGVAGLASSGVGGGAYVGNPAQTGSTILAGNTAVS